MKEKIGIVTYYNIFNYGSFLQAYALQEKISELGFEAELVEIKNSNSFIIKLINKAQKIAKIMIWPQYFSFIMQIRQRNKDSVQKIDSKVKKAFKDSIETSLNVRYYTWKEIKREASSERYRCFICGSDQIWSPLGIIIRKHKFLEFAPKQKRIAYAPSLGIEYIPKYNERAFKRKVKNISAISVREYSAKNIIERLLDVDNIPLVLDPTLLWEQNYWENKIVGHSIASPYICCYFLDCPSKERIKEIQEFSQKNNVKVIVLPYKNELLKIENAEFVTCGPFAFLDVIKNADYVLTDSYHGTIFSLIFQKKFVVFERMHMDKIRQISRIVSLLDSLDLNQRFVKSGGWIDIIELEVQNDHVESVLTHMRKISMDFLIDAIQGARI